MHQWLDRSESTLEKKDKYKNILIWISYGKKHQWLDLNQLLKKIQKWLDRYKSAMEETKNSKMTWSIWTSFGIKKKYNNDLIDLNKPWKKGKIQQWLDRSVSAFENRKNTRTRLIWFRFGGMINGINDLTLYGTSIQIMVK